MVFQDPSESQSFIEPGRYVVKVAKLELMPPSEAHPDWAQSIRWYLNLAKYPSLELLLDADKQPLEFWQYTSTSLNSRSKARPWVEAFLGRPLTDQDTGASLAQTLLGAKGLAMIGPNQAGRDAILSIQPYKAPPQNGKAPATARPEVVAALEDDLAAPAPQASAALAASRAGMDLDNDDVPF